MLLTTLAKKGPLAVLNHAKETLVLRIGLKGLQSSQILDKELLEQITSGVDNLIKKYLNDLFVYMSLIIAKTDDQNHKILWQQMMEKLISEYLTELEYEIALDEELQHSQLQSDAKQDDQYFENQLLDSHSIIVALLNSTHKEIATYIYICNQIPQTIIKNLAAYKALQPQHQRIVDKYVTNNSKNFSPQVIQQIMTDQKINRRHALVRSASHVEMNTCRGLAALEAVRKVAAEPETPASVIKLQAELAKAQEEVEALEKVYRSKQLAFERNPDNLDIAKAIDSTLNQLNQAKKHSFELKHKKEHTELLFQQDFREKHFSEDNKSKRSSVIIPPSQYKKARQQAKSELKNAVDQQLAIKKQTETNLSNNYKNLKAELMTKNKPANSRQS